MVRTFAEVHFHSDSTASCVASGQFANDDDAGEMLLLWAALANRQLVNMGKDALPLAKFLTDWSGDWGHGSAGSMKLCRLVAHSGRARRRFEARLVRAGKGRKLILKMKGFGLLGKRLDHYCPNSVVVLLRHLAQRVGLASEYRDVLVELVRITGRSFLAGKVNAYNADQLAWSHVFEASSIAAQNAEDQSGSPSDGDSESTETCAEDIETFTSALANALSDISEDFYRGYIEGMVELLPSAKGLDGKSRRDPEPTIAARFLIGSFQYWVMWDMLEDKLQLYPEFAAGQEFTDQMYIKGLGGYSPEKEDASILSLLNAIYKVQTEGGSVVEWFFHLMKEVVFTGDCRTDGSVRSMVDMGVAVDPVDHIAWRAYHGYMTERLVLTTRLAVAVAFGDDREAQELANEMDRSEG